MIEPRETPQSIIFDSDAFCVIHFPWADKRFPWESQHGFEIVDKGATTEVFLHGFTSHLFRQQMEDWKTDIPSIKTVESVLAAYMRLGVVPLVLH